MAVNTPQGAPHPPAKQGRNKVKNLPSRQIPELCGRLFGKEVKIRCRKKESGIRTCGQVCAATGRPPLFCRPGSADPSALGRLLHSSREGPQAREPAPAAATERKVRVRRCHEGREASSGGSRDTDRAGRRRWRAVSRCRAVSYFYFFSWCAFCCALCCVFRSLSLPPLRRG